MKLKDLLTCISSDNYIKIFIDSLDPNYKYSILYKGKVEDLDKSKLEEVKNNDVFNIYAHSDEITIHLKGKGF